MTNERYTNHARQRAMRKALRQRATLAERRLWAIVRDRRLGGFKFRRQHGVGHYIMDFYCAEAKLGIELYGAVHDNPASAEYDRQRQEDLEELGLRIVIFRNHEVVKEPNRVANTLLMILRGEEEITD